MIVSELNDWLLRVVPISKMNRNSTESYSQTICNSSEEKVLVEMLQQRVPQEFFPEDSKENIGDIDVILAAVDYILDLQQRMNSSEQRKNTPIERKCLR